MTLGRTDHPDVESLDAYADGERNDLAVDRHVRDCSDCAEAVAALRQVRDDLARLTSVTMPDDVASRIRAALAADHVHDHTHTHAHAHGEEPAHHAPVPGRLPQSQPLRPVSGGGGGPGERTRRRRGVGGGWRPHHLGSPREWLVAAACLAVVVAIGVVAVDGVSTTTTASLSDAASSGAAPEAATDGDLAAGRAPADSPYAIASEMASGSAADAAPVLPPMPTTASEGPVQETAVAPTTVSASNEVLVDSEFTEHAGEAVTVATVLRADVALATGEFAFAGAADIPDAAWDTLTSPTAARCYQSLAALASPSGGSVLAVDRVRYSGIVSLFVVMSSPTDPGAYVVAVVPATCAADGDASSLLTTATVARS